MSKEGNTGGVIEGSREREHRATEVPKRRPRVLVLERQGLIREGLRLLLERQAGYEVVGLAPSLDTALEVARRDQPDLVVAGLELGAGTPQGTGAVQALLAATPGARVLVLTTSADASHRVAAMRAGAHGVLGLDRTSDDLLAATSRLLEGGYAIDPALVPLILQPISLAQPSPPSDAFAGLTPREQQVARLVAEGLRNKQVALRLSISEITVRHHLTAVFAKLGVNDRLEMVLKVTRTG